MYQNLYRTCRVIVLRKGPRTRLDSLKLAISLKRVFIFESITETGAEKFVVHISLRHIHVDLARKELHLSFLLSI